MTTFPRICITLIIAILVISGQGSVYGQTTYYSYIGLQNSPWHTEGTWTTSPGGVDSENPAVPSDGDFLNIVGNRNVVLTSDVSTTGLTINIEAGSTLTIGEYEFTETIVQLDGKGNIRIGKSHFPTVTTNNFVASEGGTVEFFNFSDALPSNQLEYNNLLLNKTDASDNNYNYILGHNLTINGNLRISQNSTSGSTILTIGNSTESRDLTVYGDVTVGESTFVGVGMNDAVHQIDIYGDLVNNGSIELSNSPQYTMATNGAAVVTFKGANNNSITGTGPTLNFYRLIVDKGVDQTFTLYANPLAFRLYYVTDLSNTGTDLNPQINKALWIKNGTLKLGPNVNIPVLSEGGSDFFIPLNGALWINGATVSSTSTGGDGGHTAITVIGKLRISGGTYNGNKSAGIIYRGTAEMLIEGGTVNVSQLRPSTAPGEQIASYTQSGGTVNLGGGGATSNSYARFSLETSTHTFNMSGGTINILSPTGSGAFAIGSGPGYYNVSGGTTNITIPAGNNNVYLCSTAPLFNLNLIKSGTGTGGLSLSDISSIGAQPLVVNNNLSLGENVRLITNDLDVSVAGNFTLMNQSSYDHGANTTTFFWYGSVNNNGSTIVNNSGTSPLTFHNLTIAKNDGINYFNPAKSLILPSTGDHAVSIAGDLNFNALFQSLDLQNRKLRVQSNINVNRESIISNDDIILLSPEVPKPQDLSIGKLTSFNSFELDNTAGARIWENSSMESLTLTRGSLNIANRRLTLNNPVQGDGLGENKMISTNGLSGELRYIFQTSVTGDIIYPVGSGAALLPGETYYEFTETFDGGPALPADWQSSTTGGTQWSVTDGYANYPGNRNESARLVSPELNLSGYQTVTLNFSETRNSSGNRNDNLTVQYLDGNNNWVTIEPFTDAPTNQIRRSIILPAGALREGSRIGFLAQTPDHNHGNSTYTRIHNVEITNLVGEKKYTPFQISISGTTDYTDGSEYCGVIPVNSVHPNSGNENGSMKYYWKINSTLQTPSGLTVDYRFDFDCNDRAEEEGGISGWTIYPAGKPNSNGNYNTEPCFLNFNNIGFTSADFTGGRNQAFNPGQSTRIFRTVGSGDWDQPAVWERVDEGGGGGTGYPVAGDLAYINPNHIITTTAPAAASELTIYSGGILNLAGITGHNFGILIGDGTIRTSSGELPAVNDGLAAFTEAYNSTIEYYGDAANIPPAPSTYYNLLITGSDQKNLPDVNLNIRNRFSIEGSPVFMNNDENGDLVIAGQLTIQGIEEEVGSLTIQAGNSRTIEADNINAGPYGKLVTDDTGTGNHTITLTAGGIMVDENGEIDLYGNGNNVCDVTLTGQGSTTIGGTNGNIKLNRLVIDKEGALVDEVVVTGYLQILGPASGSTKALELKRGSFIIESEGNDAIDITLSSGGDPFTIPETAALIMRGEPASPNILRIFGGSGMTLDGLFSLSGNAQALFNSDNNGNFTENYIQYSSSGNARIEVMGEDAILNVGGQLRRLESTSAGKLHYYQSAGEVYIASAGASQDTRGVFEILNTGSSFVHTGGILSIGRSSGNQGGDIYLEPDYYEIGTAATLTIEATAAGQNIGLRAEIPLNNLTIKGTNSPTVSLSTHTLTLNGNFTLENGARFDTKNLNQTYKGDFTNSGEFEQGTSTSFFAGIDQTIEGETNFYNLFLEPSTSLTLANNTPVTVDRDMFLLTGTLFDGGNYIDVRRHLYNNSIHVSTDPESGGIRLSGDTEQLISTYTESAAVTETELFGRLELNNSAGARMMNRFDITNDLTLANGILNIQNRLLALGENSSILGVPDGTSQGSFALTNMIQTGGNMGDQGVRKFFDSSEADFNFTFPIGVAGKYTPLTISSATLSADSYPDSYIKVMPVNNYHPTIITGDPNRVLHYYWDVSGNFDTFTGEMVFNYINEDAFGDQALYYSAHLKPADDTWAKLSIGVDDDANTITFNHDNEITDNFIGYYTAGEETAIPDVIAVYTAVDDGDWDTDINWDTGTSPPNGIIVDIPSGRSIDIISHRKRAYRTVINGTLDISNTTTFHNFGLVTGTGILSLNNDFLPPGDYDDFVSCTGGTIEYGGAGPYTITSRYLNMNNLIISGSGLKTLPNNNITLCGNLDIKGTSSLEIQSGRNLNIKGSINKEDAGGLMANTGTRVIFSGTENQALSGIFTGSNSFFELQLNNSEGLSFSPGSRSEILGDLYLTSGVLTTTEPLILSKTDGLVTYSSTSYVSGPLRRRLSGTTGTHYFPVGRTGRYKLTALLDPSADDENWTAEYFYSNPGNLDSKEADVATVSMVEYWNLTGPAGESAKIQLSLSGTSDVAAAIEDTDNLRIVRWSGTTWEIVGDAAIVSGTTNAGTITTTQPVTFNGSPQKFTLATLVPVTLSSAGFNTPDATICQDESIDLEILLTGQHGWEISYTANTSSNSITITENTNSYPLTVSPQETTTYILTAVRDNDGTGDPGNLFNETVTITVNQKPDNRDVISGGNICSGQSTTITVRNTELNFNYELIHGGSRTGNILAGNGEDLTFVGISEPGEYSVWGYAPGYPDCYREMDMPLTISEVTSPTAILTTNPPGPVCESNPVAITLDFAGTQPYTFSIKRTFINESDEEEVVIIDDHGAPFEHSSEETFSYLDENLVWYDIGERPINGTKYTYTLIGFTDANGCPGTFNNTDIDVWKIPETGPQYHIPNTFGH